jgi:arylformamidase
MHDHETQYVAGQGRDDFPELLADFQHRSDCEAARRDAVIDRPYGDHERQRLDFFPASGPARGTLLYYHAGYWQSRDKSNFRFIAGPLNTVGLNVALANYPLCPQVTLVELVQYASEAPAAVGSMALDVPLILAGHSAGAHLAVELAMGDLAQAPPIAGVVAVSGVFDLRPLTQTSLNRNLRLDPAGAALQSPILRPKRAAPAIFAVGAEETDAFLEQNAAMATAWRNAGNAAEEIAVGGAHHFSVLSSLIDPASELHRRMIALV